MSENEKSPDRAGEDGDEISGRGLPWVRIDPADHEGSLGPVLHWPKYDPTDPAYCGIINHPYQPPEDRLELHTTPEPPTENFPCVMVPYFETYNEPDPPGQEWAYKGETAEARDRLGAAADDLGLALVDVFAPVLRAASDLMDALSYAFASIIPPNFGKRVRGAENLQRVLFFLPGPVRLGLAYRIAFGWPEAALGLLDLEDPFFNEGRVE